MRKSNNVQLWLDLVEVHYEFSAPHNSFECGVVINSQGTWTIGVFVVGNKITMFASSVQYTVLRLIREFDI